MKISEKQTIGENLLYGMVWSAMFLVPILYSQMMAEPHISFENVLINWRQIIPYFVIFIIHNSVLAPKFMLRRRYVWYLGLDTLLVVTVFLLVYLYEKHLVELRPELAAVSEESILHGSFTNLEFYWNVVLGFFMTGANTGIKLIYQSMRDEQKMERLKQQTLEAEMMGLKYQLNPHFFMNTLNNIHALIDIDSEMAKQTVIELSKMMRYVLYDSGYERISFNREMQFVEHYIELMRIRYTDNIRITVNYPTLSEQICIPPLLLIVFVENAFKHGVSYDAPSFIDLQVCCEDNRLIVTVTNSRHHHAEQSSAGIGIENARKRLELIYGEKNFSLDIREEATTYTVQLIIPTLHD